MEVSSVEKNQIHKQFIFLILESVRRNASGANGTGSADESDDAAGSDVTLSTERSHPIPRHASCR